MLPVTLGAAVNKDDGVPVRNREELVLAVARLRVGESVQVAFRRDGAEQSLEVSPRPLGE